ncbi:MAG: recombinase family protein [Oscillospiraceae bacterium]|jgi:DNA invertase Pin-like site-specific DNA recombinase|nr:recombinase family protein [Oscillospiraceae bacterium]
MKAVIYARYSSHNQTELSIEGQLSECYKFAKREGYTIIKEYIDRAKTATTDRRPQFQKMIKDSEKRQFEAVLVYQLDRFARNRYDSAIHKNKLRKNGVKVISAREVITQDASGILLESVLEGYAEYFSAELSQKVKRSVALRIEKCQYLGGGIPLGYTVDENKQFQLDPLTVPVVHRCFDLYLSGNTLKDINEAITKEFGREFFGNIFNGLNKVLDNRNYIGYYTRGGADKKDGMPRIISDELFERVQIMRHKDKKTSAKAKAHEEYLLTTKLFCGYCKEMMVGVSGTSRTGKTHSYYTCKSVWNKKGCKKKNVKKHDIENFIIAQACQQLTDENITLISKMLAEQSKQENYTPYLSEIKKKLKDNAKAVENLLKAIESGEHMGLLSERITQKKQERAELEKALALEQMERIEIDEDEISYFLTKLREGNIDDIHRKRAIIAVFVSAIYLYDDRATIVFNATDKPLTIDFQFLLDKMERGEYNGIGERRESGSYTTDGGV